MLAAYYDSLYRYKLLRIPTRADCAVHLCNYEEIRLCNYLLTGEQCRRKIKVIKVGRLIVDFGSEWQAGVAMFHLIIILIK